MPRALGATREDTTSTSMTHDDPGPVPAVYLPGMARAELGPDRWTATVTPNPPIPARAVPTPIG